MSIKIKTYSASYKGLRDSNEDFHNIIIGKKSNLFAVYDGHGGSDVSKFLKEKIPEYLTDTELPIKKIDIYKIFANISKDLKNNKLINSTDTGSTCLCAIQHNNKLQLMNCGDSRAILSSGKKAIQLTIDHKPNEINEKNRLQKIKGNEKIYKDDGIWRIGDLAVSRSFGDFDTSPYITSKPEITTYEITNKDKFLILACDGLWDVVSNSEAIRFVYQNPNDTARKLASYALKKGSSDNISIIIVMFEHQHNLIGGKNSSASINSNIKNTKNKQPVVTAKNRPATATAKNRPVIDTAKTN
ncbi:protein phosphatase 2C domain-containing protein, partial [bacterium]|nr:protein phosphatase 2C domain-containing protein [bacterium]